MKLYRRELVAISPFERRLHRRSVGPPRKKNDITSNSVLWRNGLLKAAATGRLHVLAFCHADRHSGLLVAFHGV